jgi:hypothetical protein
MTPHHEVHLVARHHAAKFLHRFTGFELVITRDILDLASAQQSSLGIDFLGSNFVGRTPCPSVTTAAIPDKLYSNPILIGGLSAAPVRGDGAQYQATTQPPTSSKGVLA